MDRIRQQVRDDLPNFASDSDSSAVLAIVFNF
jgi:hypothetical protein